MFIVYFRLNLYSWFHHFQTKEFHHNFLRSEFDESLKGQFFSKTDVRKGSCKAFDQLWHQQPREDHLINKYLTLNTKLLLKLILLFVLLIKSVLFHQLLFHLPPTIIEYLPKSNSNLRSFHTFLFYIFDQTECFL